MNKLFPRIFFSLILCALFAACNTNDGLGDWDEFDCKRHDGTVKITWIESRYGPPSGWQQVIEEAKCEVEKTRFTPQEVGVTETFKYFDDWASDPPPPLQLELRRRVH